MNYIFNRLIQNDFGWRKPSPGRKGPHGEGDYVKENGFGHEDWNFNCDLIIDGYLYGYCYYFPTESKLKEIFNIVFAIYKNSKWFIVGFYENAIFEINPPISKNIINKKINDLRMLGNSLGSEFSKLNDKDFYDKMKNEVQYLRLKVKPEDVIILDDPVELPSSIFYTSNYRIVKPTNINEEIFNKIKDYVSYYSYNIDISEFPEGREYEITHKIKERNTKVVNLAKDQYFNKTNSFKCEVCNFDFFDIYGEIGKGFIEAHHIKPISEFNEIKKVTIDDFVMLCSNCHKMIHRKRPWLTHNELKELLLKSREKST